MKIATTPGNAEHFCRQERGKGEQTFDTHLDLLRPPFDAMRSTVGRIGGAPGDTPYENCSTS